MPMEWAYHLSQNKPIIFHRLITNLDGPYWMSYTSERQDHANYYGRVCDATIPPPRV